MVNKRIHKIRGQTTCNLCIWNEYINIILKLFHIGIGYYEMRATVVTVRYLSFDRNLLVLKCSSRSSSTFTTTVICEIKHYIMIIIYQQHETSQKNTTTVPLPTNNHDSSLVRLLFTIW